MNSNQLEGQMSIFDWMPDADPNAKVNYKTMIKSSSYQGINPNACKHSKHECNKKELWKVAEGLWDGGALDLPCPRVCCRMCSNTDCGARCNGAPEPKKKHDDVKYIRWLPMEKHIPPEDTYLEFMYMWTRNQKNDSKGVCPGWYKDGKVTWHNMPYDIGKKEIIAWRYKRPEGKGWNDVKDKLPAGYGSYYVRDTKGNEYTTIFNPTINGFNHVMHYSITHWREVREDDSEGNEAVPD